jgi:hypothetical protein
MVSAEAKDIHEPFQAPPQRTQLIALLMVKSLEVAEEGLVLLKYIEQ